MRKRKYKRPEISFLVQTILPILSSQYGFSQPDDYEHTKIQEIPVRMGGTIHKPDVVYYWDGVPVVLVEAKREDQSLKEAQGEALSYVKNFPTDERYSKDGRRPKYVAITIGKEIKFYLTKFEVTPQGDFKDYLIPLDTIPTFKDILNRYGLIPEYKPKILSPDEFREEFLNELLAIYTLDKNQKINRDVVLKVSWQLLSYLEDPQNYTSRQPYISLDNYKDRQSHIRQLFNQYDILNSLGPENAKEFRRFVLRAFQGGGLNQYMTEQCVINFMVSLVNPQPHWKVLDFECGSGGFLAAVIEKGNIPLDNILGVDIDELPYIVAKTYLAIYFSKVGNQVKFIPIKHANGLYYYGNDWDLIISNPAGSDRYPHPDIDKVLENLESDLDLNGRPDKFSEYNFSIQQAIRSAKVGGKICLILPEGFFSNAQDEILRKYVAKHCRVLAIISLPRGIFRRGTETRRASGGSQLASMKMSILYAEKVREVKDREGLDLSDIDLNYPVFLANIEAPSTRTSNIEDWLEPRLELVLKEWKSWQEKQSLSQETPILKAEKAKKLIKKPIKKSLPKEKQPPTLKKKVVSKIKIDKNLESLF